MDLLCSICNQGQEERPGGNWRNSEEVSTVCIFFLPLIAEALHFQQKLDETTKLLHELQEAQRERLSAKQPPNMICLLAPTAKELQLGKRLLMHGPFVPPTPSCRPTALSLPPGSCTSFISLPQRGAVRSSSG